MAYVQYTYRFKDSIEYEYKYAGNYGAKGEKRAKRKKATPEQIKTQNQKNRENKVRRLIKANFTSKDLWITLKYPKGTRLEAAAVQKDFKKFLDSLRKKYLRRGKELKFIYRMEIGKKGGVHIHMVVNSTEDAFEIIQESWKPGRVNFECLYERGGYEQLASYLVKPPDEEINQQLSFFPLEDRKHFIKYSSSRNLVRPEPEVKRYNHWTMRKIINEGPVAHEGYYIDQNSIKHGINQYTGYSYLYFTEIKKRGSDEECKT